ncbi:MAG: SHOCT domain-containing protein [Dehalococcoidia bacterium]
MMRRRGPGLVRGVARTAAVAGTAAVVAGGVRHRQEQRWDRKEQEQYEEQAAQQAAIDNQTQMAQMQQQLTTLQAQQAQAAMQPPQAPVAAPATGSADVTARLKELADLKAAGILTDEEFAAAKAKVLSGG